MLPQNATGTISNEDVAMSDVEAVPVLVQQMQTIQERQKVSCCFSI